MRNKITPTSIAGKIVTPPKTTALATPIVWRAVDGLHELSCNQMLSEIGFVNELFRWNDLLGE
jgi:hypothetical protein